ncbi:MAG: hypothetical protein ACRD1E_03280 [Terriglobales bacterium]
MAAISASPEESAAAAEAMERLAAALQRLPATQRHDLVLYLLEGFRPAELAQLSGRSLAQVMASLEQAEAGLHAHPQLPQLLRHRLPLELSPAPGPRRRRGAPPQMRPQRA